MRLTSNAVAIFLASRLWVILLSCPSSHTTPLPPISTNRDPPCTGSFDWLSPKFESSDCTAAITKFYRLDVARHGTRELEFVGPSGVFKTNLPKIRTPRRYTVGRPLNPNTPEKRSETDCEGLPIGSCTLVIAMLDVFPRMDLPDPPPTPSRLSDVSNFYDLHQAAMRVQSTCVQWIHQAGYLDLGRPTRRLVFEGPY